MVQESGTFAAYNGKISDIPQASTTSPGLGFLKLYLCTVDALEQRYASPPLMDFLAKHCVSITNGSDPFPAARLPEMFTAREKMLSKFTHDGFPIRAFDLERSDGKRTVICEAVSVSVFKDDVKQEAIEVSESLVLELSPVQEADQGVYGFQATSITTYMDPAPVQAKVKEVMAGR